VISGGLGRIKKVWFPAPVCVVKKRLKIVWFLFAYMRKIPYLYYIKIKRYEFKSK
tara:strand:- start:330 stop:494 length:165 start_codon:yes stop_codon:yes gene_type:complete